VVNGDEPTEKQLERDIKRLLDGKVIIENETPKTAGGVRKVVDNVKTGKSTIIETAESEKSE
jgi:hypothetical protein